MSDSNVKSLGLTYEDVAFISALTCLGICGCLVLFINYKTETRKRRYLSTIAKTLWNFNPNEQIKIDEMSWQWRKLLLSGVMLSSLIVSTTVHSIKYELALKISCTFLCVWIVGISVFWHTNVSPHLQTTDKTIPTLSNVTSNNNIDNENSEIRDDRLPVSIITGYLGAGKTTLLKKILHKTNLDENNSIFKILVIENEIGDEGIDHELLLSNTNKENIVLMNNGCICCSVRKDIIDTFHTLFTKIENLEKQINWVVIETTGIADPAPLILSLYMDKVCKEKLRLDGVITVVDSININKHMLIKSDEGASKEKQKKTPINAIAHSNATVSEIIKQIAYADRIILSKVDLLVGIKSPPLSSMDQSVLMQQLSKNPLLQAIQKQILEINPNISGIYPCIQGDIEIHKVLNIHAFDIHHSNMLQLLDNEQNAGMLDNAFCQTININRLNKKNNTKNTKSTVLNRINALPDLKPDKSVNSDSLGSSPSPLITTNISTISLTTMDALNFDAINVWLVDLLQNKGIDIFRMKGLLYIKGYEEQFVVQGVHMLFDGCKGSKWSDLQSKHGNEMEKKSTLVFIGLSLNEHSLRKDFLSCREKVVTKNKSNK